MDQEESVPAHHLVIPLPMALYCSNGLLFELYEGGQPFRRHHIVWERVKTTEEPPPIAPPSGSSPGPSSDASRSSIRD